MYSCKHAVPYVAAKILTSCENYAIIGSEQTNHWLCDKLDDNSHNQTKPGRDKDCIAKCKLGTLRLSSTDVLSTQCRDSKSIEDGTKNKKLITFSTMPTAAESVRPRLFAMMVIIINAI